MTTTADITSSLLAAPAVEPLREMGTYEALWESDRASFKTIAETFEQNPTSTPSQLVPEETITETVPKVLKHIERAGVGDFNVCVHGTAD